MSTYNKPLVVDEDIEVTLIFDGNSKKLLAIHSGNKLPLDLTYYRQIIRGENDYYFIPIQYTYWNKEEFSIRVGRDEELGHALYFLIDPSNKKNKNIVHKIVQEYEASIE